MLKGLQWSPNPPSPFRHVKSELPPPPSSPNPSFPRFDSANGRRLLLLVLVPGEERLAVWVQEARQLVLDEFVVVVVNGREGRTRVPPLRVLRRVLRERDCAEVRDARAAPALRAQGGRRAGGAGGADGGGAGGGVAGRGQHLGGDTVPAVEVGLDLVGDGVDLWLIVLICFVDLCSDRELQRGDEIAWYPDGDKVVRCEYNPATAYAFGNECASFSY